MMIDKTLFHFPAPPVGIYYVSIIKKKISKLGIKKYRIMQQAT
jgi:hypothetical protein